MTAHSRGGWSDPGADRDFLDETEPPSPDRYRISDELGAGGMGEVFVAWDSKLAREIALKRSRGGVDPKRLAREASITARLEHPGIVPLYDSGVDDDGRVFYTMRLLRGQSLAAALPELPIAVLLRHFLTASQAVAFAHSRRVVHRDLKPANIMLGAFGETHVVDWGLAVDLERTPAPTRAGTPGYMAPEPAASPASDTYSLGKVLEELLANSAGSDTCPPDLATIAQKATAGPVAERYPSAAELARDLEDFLDGRRVAAHDYSSWEIVQRLAKAWRGPLIVAALSALLLIALALFGLDRIRSQRNRAQVAEAEAVRALGDQSETLKWALAEQADALYRNDNVPEAEIVAAHSIGLGDSPKARGVLVASRSRPRPNAVETTALAPGCAEYLLSDDKHYVCRNRNAVALYQLGFDTPRWSIATTVRSLATRGGRVAILDREYTLVVVEADGTRRSFGEYVVRNHVGLRFGPAARRVGASDGRRVVWTDLDAEGLRREVRPCSGYRVGSLVLGRSRVFVACEQSGLVLAFDARTAAAAGSWTVPFTDRAAPPHRMAVSADESRLAITSIKGSGVELDLHNSEVSRVVSLAPGPAELQYAGGRVLVQPAAGGATLFDLSRRIATMPLPRNTVAAVAWKGALVTIHDERAHRWHLSGPGPGAHRFQSPSGLSGMDAYIDPADASAGWVAAARGDGTLSLWSLDGRSERERPIASHVLKAVSFSPDGTSVAVAQAERPGLSFHSVPSLAPSARGGFPRGIRRLRFTPSGQLVLAPYSNGFFRMTGDKRTEHLLTEDVVDLSLQGSVAWLLTRAGAVYRHAPSDAAPTKVADADAASGVAGLPDGRTIIARRSSVWLETSAGGVDLQSPSRRLLDVAASPDGRFIASGGIGGDIHVWSVESHSLTATWKAHDERISQLRFIGGDLFSASWDGSVRRWRLDGLDRDAASIIRDAEQAWDTSLDEALRSSGR